MTIYTTTKTITNIDRPLNEVEKREVHDLLRNGKSREDICNIMGNVLSHAKVQLVIKELKSLESEIINKVQGNYVISPAVPEQKDDEGNIVSEAKAEVRFVLTTKDALMKSVETYYDKDKLIEDIVKYNPTYDENRTWTNFKNSIQCLI